MGVNKKATDMGSTKFPVNIEFFFLKWKRYVRIKINTKCEEQDFHIVLEF